MTTILKNMRKWIAIKKQKERESCKGKIRKLKKNTLKIKIQLSKQKIQ